ncbi:hypothetical protein MINTMi198_09740 [Mycobacterium intracellulare M.i.198]|nr:hypothetical protein MINTMi198_09740 [Mycobacterium intracellulare M.i.198]
MHRDPDDLELAELGEHRTHHFGRRTADGPGDDDDLGAIDLALDDVAKLLGAAADDPDAVDLGTGVAGRGRQCIRVDVVDLAVPRGAGNVDQFPPSAMIVTRGRGWTSTRSRPTAASSPTWAAPMTVPARTATSPGWTSSPARRT